MKKALVSILKFVLPLGLGLFLVWFIYKDLSESDKNTIFTSFKNADYSWLIVSFFIGALSHVVRAHRWLLLLDTLGFKPRLINSFFSVMTGYLANMAFPRLGEVTRCGVMSKYEKIPFEKLLGTVLVERVIDMLILLTLTFITIITQWTILSGFISERAIIPLKAKLSEGSFSNKLIIMFIIMILLAVVIYLLKKKAAVLFQKIKEFFFGLLEGFKTVLHIKNKPLFIIESLSIWVLYFIMFYVCFFCLPETETASFSAVLSAFVLGSYGVIAVQGGLGAYPAIVSATLVLYGIPLASGFAFGWIAWTGQLIMILVLGFLSVFMMPQVNKSIIVKAN